MEVILLPAAHPGRLHLVDCARDEQRTQPGKWLEDTGSS